MDSPSLTIETRAGAVRATAGPRQADSVVFELSGAMRGSVQVTGTHHPHHWDQFTAVRACLGPVNAFQTTAPGDALPRLARSRTGYRGSLTLYRDDADPPEVTVYPMQSAAEHDPSEKTAAVLTAVLRACAEHVAQRDDLPEILDISRQRDTPAAFPHLVGRPPPGRSRPLRAGSPCLPPRAASRRNRLVDRRTMVHRPPAPGPAAPLLAAPQLAGPHRRRQAVVGPLLPHRGRPRARTRPPRPGRSRLPAHPAAIPAPRPPPEIRCPAQGASGNGGVVTMRWLMPLGERSRRAGPPPDALPIGARGGLSRPTAAPESRDRAYFVVGQWKGGGDVDVWHVEEPPADPTLNVFENKEAFLFCNYDRSKALCHPGRGTKSAAPSLDRCKVNCANIARTDTHAHQLRQAADDLGRQVASGLVPEPLADRLRERAQVLTELAHQHDHDRVMAAAGTEL